MTAPHRFIAWLQLMRLPNVFTAVADVAKELNRSIGSIHMICHRALKLLREQAEEMGITME